MVDRGEQRPLGILAEKLRARLGGNDRALLFLGSQNVRRALGAGEEVLAVFRIEEDAKRSDAADDQQQIIGIRRNHRVDQIMPRTLVAEVNFQAIMEE